MSSDNPTESEILERITTGLDRECERRDVSLTPGDAIKRQKYVDIALFEYLSDVDEPPVTISWYKYGRTTPAGGGGAAMTSPQTTISPGNQPDPTQEFLSMNAADFADFYRTGAFEPSLERANEDTLPFLRRYYLEYAPDRFRDLYLVNVRLREALQELRKKVDPGTSCSSSEWGLEQEYRNVAQLTSKIELFVSQDEIFSPVTGVVPDFFRLVEQTFAGIASFDDETPNYDHYTFVTQLEDFYKDQAWGHIAHCISRETAVGPGAEQIRDWSNEALEAFADPFNEEVEYLKSECIRVNAYPEPSAYPTRTDDASNTLDELLRVASKPDESDNESMTDAEGRDS